MSTELIQKGDTVTIQVNPRQITVYDEDNYVYVGKENFGGEEHNIFAKEGCEYTGVMDANGDWSMVSLKRPTVPAGKAGMVLSPTAIEFRDAMFSRALDVEKISVSQSIKSFQVEAEKVEIDKFWRALKAKEQALKTEEFRLNDIKESLRLELLKESRPFYVKAWEKVRTFFGVE